MSGLGPIVFGKRESLPFLGWETENERNYSEKTASAIDAETERFIQEAESQATALLQQKKSTLNKIAKALIEKETLEKEEFEELLETNDKKLKTKARTGARSSVVEHATYNRRVGGPIPPGPTII